MKGQIALWTLTKIGMLFFIVALAMIVTSFAGREKQALCTNRAQAVATSIGSAIAQVVNSPLEDERIVFALEPVLSVGKTDLEKYVINITQHNTTGTDVTNPFLVIEVYTEGPGCSAGMKVGYPKEMTVDFSSPPSNKIKIGGNEFRVMTITPSKPDIGGTEYRSRFVAIIRCQSKSFPPARFLFIEDCKKQDSSTCYNFDSFKEACQWS